MRQNHDFIFLFLVLIVKLHDRNGNIGKKLMYIVALYAFIFENAFIFKISLYMQYIYIYTINIQYIYIYIYIYTIDIYIYIYIQ